MIKSLLPTVFLAFACLANAADKGEYPDGSVGATKAIPNRLVKDSMREMAQEAFLQAKFDGYVILRGRVQSNREFDFSAIKKAEPKGKYEKLAKYFAENVKLIAFETGSHMRPSAFAYVIIFEPGNSGVEEFVTDSGLVAIFTEQTNLPTGGSTFGRRSVYLFEYAGLEQEGFGN